ncbi:hypothetical protein BST33_12040 [Mycolicibacter minnesotensis]|uniref:Uncharacterized protein n=2 Tax=Mycolicibacter minnesotensis TaxID=1118379 RepID=A0A7I7R538_9MYCO|nr:hypothetical protein BST33_12040 [Mycolicibacter minnesotensis]BBY33754.1 hypothetical protein MMIN_18150 [Mycolicibacter minnesotensis]
MTDLPSGKWSSYLVGEWWPAPPTGPTSGVGYWSDHSSAKEHEAVELQAFTDGVSARNSGQTTEDELMRLRTGYNRLANAAEHCRSKSTASDSVAKAVDELRTRLRNIADQYNPRIDELVAKNTPESMAQAIGLIATANAEATERGSEANGKIIAATQQMFNELGVEGDAQRWLEDNGAKFGPPPSQPPTSEELRRKAAGPDQLPFPYGAGYAENHAGPNNVDELLLPAGPANSGTGGNDTRGTGGTNSGGLASGGPPSDGNSAVGPAAGHGGVTQSGGATAGVGVVGPPDRSGTGPNPGVSGTTGGLGGTGTSSSGVITGNTATGTSSTGTGISGLADSTGGQTGITNLGPSGPSGGSGGFSGGGVGSPGGAPSPMASAMPGLGGPPGGGGGMPPGLPTSGPTQALAAGMPGGGPPGLGGPPPTPGTGGSGLGGFGQPSQIPPSPSVTPMAGGALGNMAQLASPSTEVAPAAPTAGATPATPATAPVTASPSAVPSGPISAGPVGPSGPLPGYGADLRPAAPAAPPVPSVPPGPTPPSAPGAPTTPTSGGPTVASAGDRPAAGKPAPGAGGQSAASLAGSMGAGSTAGAGAGTAARRLAEHQDLQRKVDAVARQAPNLAWAAGLRDDETTILLATDVAGGWIPPTVKLPPGLTLLDPAHRRRDTSAVDLLGAVIAAAAHQPNTYVTEAGPNDPIPGSGERARYGQHVDELGPTLIEVTGANARLPRIVQTVARAMARRSGVADNEVELFRQVVTTTQTQVLSAYPQHAPRDVADWMLLAAIDALIDGSEELARYHLSWYLVTAGQHGGVAP